MSLGLAPLAGQQECEFHFILISMVRLEQLFERRAREDLLTVADYLVLFETANICVLLSSYGFVEHTG